MVENSNASHENEFTELMPFQRGFQKYKFLVRKALISGKGRQEKLRKWPKTGKSVVMQIRGWSTLIENTGIALVFLFVAVAS